MSDGLRDFLIGLLAALAGSKGWLNEKLNALLINKLATQGRTRPHPWSTRDDYISWSGLTDRHFNARLLPADHAFTGGLPAASVVAALFNAPVSGQRPSTKSTCLFPAFAQYLTDGFIRTQLNNVDALEDRRRTTSNHEIDQSPLYGRTEAQTNVLRRRSDVMGERGRLESQMIQGEEFSPFLYGADGAVKPKYLDANGVPILDEPLGVTKPFANKPTLFAVGGDRVNAAPQVAMMNTLFLREHNRLAGMIEARHPAWNDERVFQTARNISIVMFIKLVVEEYINHINTMPFKLRALPNVAWDAKWNRPNWMTAEFSLLYRWHSLIPKEMTWNGTPINGTALLLNNTPLLDRGLANAFADISGNVATELGLGNSADFLFRAELKAVEQARTNNITGYNAYRKAMKLKPAMSFTEIVGTSKDPATQTRLTALATALAAHYGTVDKLEFYIGIFAEPCSRNGPLPELLTAMVAMDAFSQAMTNPLLSLHIWGDEANRLATFTAEGLAAIEATPNLRTLLERNSSGLGTRFVGMTQEGWKRR